MKYVKTFEMSQSNFNNFLKKDWEIQKKFLDRFTVKNIDDYIKHVDAIGQRISDAKDKISRQIAAKDFKSAYNKLNTLIRQAKSELNISFKVGQKFEISKMYSFNYNDYHNTLRPEKDRCLSIEEYGMPNYLVYSDIVITDVSPTGKTITISFNGINFSSGFNFNRKDYSLKVRIDKMKVFYFNLMNDKYYQEVMSDNYAKKINESTKYNRNIQSQLDEVLDKINSGGLSSLSDDEKVFIKSFKSGKEKETYKNFNKKVYEDGIFKFTLNKIEPGHNSKKFIGELEVSDISFEGYITQLSSGMTDIQFNDNDGKTIWDHANGYEYYLDDFINNIIMDNE
tara:strand:- start:95510 stop:96526 length:1017 start_codon:yes stop_codon:yes gene_type:complete